MSQLRRRKSSGREQAERFNNLPVDGPCPECGKKRWLNRKAARKAAHRTNPGQHLSVYQCGDFYHIGHTPRQIKLGYQARNTA